MELARDPLVLEALRAVADQLAGADEESSDAQVYYIVVTLLTLIQNNRADLLPLMVDRADNALDRFIREAFQPIFPNALKQEGQDD
jgi:hypothetical protein